VQFVWITHLLADGTWLHAMSNTKSIAQESSFTNGKTMDFSVSPNMKTQIISSKMENVIASQLRRTQLKAR
jgi:hypothetical protein